MHEHKKIVGLNSYGWNKMKKEKKTEEKNREKE